MYSNALTLLKDDKKLLPLNCKETYYYVPLEEAPFQTFADQLNLETTVIVKKPNASSRFTEKAILYICRINEPIAYGGAFKKALL